MSDVFIRLSNGSAVTWKDSVATSGDLPASGNTPGDARIVISGPAVYVWDGSSWVDTSSSGSGTPGGPDDSLQFKDGTDFAGANELKWNDSQKALNLNGLSLKALSGTVSLVDDTSTPTTAFSYLAASYKYSVIEYSISRNGQEQVGSMYIANNGSTASITNNYASTVELGIDFSVNVSAGNVNIQYTTTATGFNGFLRYSIRQWV